MSNIGLAFMAGTRKRGNVFVVETKAPAGTVLESHRHRHGHLSVLVSGTADVTVDGITSRMTGYRMGDDPGEHGA